MLFSQHTILFPQHIIWFPRYIILFPQHIILFPDNRLITLGDLTWPRPLASVRSGHLECQVSRSSYPGIYFL